MPREIRPAMVLVIALTPITGAVYPFAITGIAEVIFPDKAQGSLVERDGKVVGSALIGQGFTSEGYSSGRPSATTAPDPNERLGGAIAKLRQEIPRLRFRAIS